MELLNRNSQTGFSETQGAHGRTGLADFLCLLCFPPRRFSSQGRRPQNGSASTGKLNHFSVCCGNRSNGIAGWHELRLQFSAHHLCAFVSLVREFRRIPWRKPNAEALFTVSLCLLALTLSGFAQTKKPAMKKSTAGPAPDKAYLQKIWDGWSTLDPANVAKYYATGPHTFFDIAPLKYNSWDEYEKGAKAYSPATRAQSSPSTTMLTIHPHGELGLGHGHGEGRDDHAKLEKSRWEISAGRWFLKTKTASG